jgi:tetratricopeptide (TPR) repeat protein
MAEPVPFKYRAFISYSHADTTWAKWLHRALESFRIDKDLAGRETAIGAIPTSLRPIFRDRDDFTAGHSLNEQTLAALDASAALIVVCSPAAPVIPLIVAGKPDDPEIECFPPALKFKLDAKGRITKRKVELLAADAREQGDGKQLALAKVVAGLLGVSSDDIFRRAERERRRKGRVRNTIIAALALLAVAATGSAIYAWHELKTNEAFLTATLKTATDIVDMAVEQAERFGVPRTATLALLTKAEGLFDNMALLGSPTPELRYQKAWMLIQFARNYAALGDSAKWKERALQAHQILAGLVTEDPGEIDYQRGLLAADNAIGDVLVTQGNLDEALGYYRDGLAIAARLAAADPSNAALQRDLSVSYTRIGDVLLDQGKFDEALASYREDLAIALRLAASDPSNTGWQRDFALSYDKVADVLLAQDKLDEAFASYRDGFAIRDRLAKSDAGKAGLQYDLGISHERIGDVLKAKGDLGGALAAYEAKRDIGRRLVEADPDNTAWQRDLSVAYDKIGDVLLAQGDLPGALASYQADLAIAERLAAKDPNNAEWQHDLSATYDRVGNALEKRSDLAAALVAYRRSLAIRERLAAADPSNVAWQKDLALSYGQIGGVLAEQGDHAAALTELAKGREIIARLKEQFPDISLFTELLAWFDRKITTLQQASTGQPLEPAQAAE